MAKIFGIREPSLDALKAAPIHFRYGSNKNLILIDGLTAQALLAVYNALSEPNQVKFEAFLQTPRKLEKLVALAWKHVTIA